MFFKPDNFIAHILVRSVLEAAEDAGVSLDLLKSSLEESKIKSLDFFTSINSILICSCSYFDCEQLKQSFFNTVCDYVRTNFTETPEISHKEREMVALAALTYSRTGVDLVLSGMTDEDSKNNFLSELDIESLFEASYNDTDQLSSEQKTTDFLKHNIQFNIWKKAKEILSVVQKSKIEITKIEKSISHAALI